MLIRLQQQESRNIDNLRFAEAILIFKLVLQSLLLLAVDTQPEVEQVQIFYY